MAGLLIKELLLRGDAANVMVVSPGVLVDQWDEEMREKFGLEFEMLTRDKILNGAIPSPAVASGWPASTSSRATARASWTRHAMSTGT